MKCPFKTPAKYEMKITSTEYVVVDAERKAIAKCNDEDYALYIQEAINSHEKLNTALEIISDLQDHRFSAGTGHYDEVIDELAKEALKEAEKE